MGEVWKNPKGRQNFRNEAGESWHRGGIELFVGERILPCLWSLNGEENGRVAWGSDWRVLSTAGSCLQVLDWLTALQRQVLKKLFRKTWGRWTRGWMLWGQTGGSVGTQSGVRWGPWVHGETVGSQRGLSDHVTRILPSQHQQSQAPGISSLWWFWSALLFKDHKSFLYYVHLEMRCQRTRWGSLLMIIPSIRHRPENTSELLDLNIIP